MASTRLNIHSHYHRLVAVLIAIYPFTIGAIAGPWPVAVVLIPAGAFVVWRIAFVRLAETDEGELLVRNALTTRRFSPGSIDRLIVGRGRFDTRGHSRLVEVHRTGGRRWHSLGSVQCSATMTFSYRRAQASSLDLAAWAEAHGVRCDVDPHQLVSGFSGLVPVTPRDRCDAMLTAGIHRLRRELHHAPGQHRSRTPPPSAPEPTHRRTEIDPTITVMAAYEQVEVEARRIAARGGIEEADLHRLVLRARSAGLVHRSATAAIEEVVAVHRMVSRGELVPTPSQARRYVDLVDAELIALRLPPRG